MGKYMKKKHTIRITGLLCFSFFITSCGQSSATSASSVIKEAVNTDSIKQIISEDNETTDTAIDVSDQSSNLTTDKVSNVTCSWEDSEVPIEVGNDNSKALIKDTRIVNSSYGTLLIMDFTYTNNTAQASDFINDSNCDVKPYQNGIELDRPGITSEAGVYDYSDAFTNVKDGGIINTQLVWVLKDTMNPVEIDFGIDSNYNPAYSKTLTLTGGKDIEDKQDESQETKESDYNISWLNDNVPEKIGNDNSYAILKNTSVLKSPSYGIVLVMDFEYTNNLDKARNFINNTPCLVKIYQNGVELDSPGNTSEQGIFDYSNAFTGVKNGGTLKTQLVWVLPDDKSPVEVEFGLDNNYKPQYDCTLNISEK